MLVGFHLEGNDHLIVKALLSRMLQVPEDSITIDLVDRPRGRGRDWVERLAEKALKRFYAKCAVLAIVGIDNDGDVDLDSSAAGGLVTEDPTHPRHAGHRSTENAHCIECTLRATVERVRPKLTWIPRKSGATWPIVIAVPVEAIEAWLLAAQAARAPGNGDLRAEQRRRSMLKGMFYGAPVATEDLVKARALPLVRSLEPEAIESIRKYSKSFDSFCEQISIVREAVLRDEGCL